MPKLRENCSYCGKAYTQEEMRQRREAQRQNAFTSRAKAEANGKRVERKRRANIEKVRFLRRSGKSVAFIAGVLNVSISAVYRALAAPSAPGEGKP